MAKIKFNLNFGGEQIRTLDDLRDNFSIDDVLDVFNNGLLVKWLDVHNHKHELEKVNSIQATDARGILTELIRIFGISDDPYEIQESLSVLDYLEERKKVHENMKAHGIPDYEKVKKERDELARQIEELKESQKVETSEVEVHEETPKPAKKTYDELMQEIINNHKDLNHIYDCLDVITADYSDVLTERYSELFNLLYNSVTHVCYTLIAHHATRLFYVLNKDDWNNIYDENNLCFMRDSKKWYLESPSVTFQDRILRTDKKLDEIAQRVSVSVREKLSIINKLRNFSLKIFTEKIGEKYADSCWVIAKRFFFLEALVYDIIDHSLHDEFDTWFSVEASNKKFMLLYGDEEDHRFTSMADVIVARFGASKAGGLALAFASTDNHNKLTKSSELSLNFPVPNGINAVAVCVDYSLVPNCNERGFCYIEAR